MENSVDTLKSVDYLKVCTCKRKGKSASGKDITYTSYYGILQDKQKDGTFKDRYIIAKDNKPYKASFNVSVPKAYKGEFEKLNFPFITVLDSQERLPTGENTFFVVTQHKKDSNEVMKYSNGNPILVIVFNKVTNSQPANMEVRLPSSYLE